MNATEIRSRFLAYFEARGHARVPSSSLVPEDDPTLLFTNAGMVQFKRAFLGDAPSDGRRAVTAQKCVRAGGKHNDLEQVGHTARHHTFFEMLGNFSFGDYFKREAIGFAWEFLTVELGIPADRLYVTVHHTDDEAYRLWVDVAGVDETRIFRMGDRDNFWQMADTGPCGPCSELHFDLRAEGERILPSAEEFERLGEEGVFLELWNLVFMQFDRDEAGVLKPLPAPSIDTGAGLERLAAVLQGEGSNYHTDLFLPLLQRVADSVGRPYDADSEEGVSFRVLADHSRAVAFLLADGVFPSNEGRGYVLRRILRRGVRHAWLLGMREPVLVDVVEEVLSTMGDAYPELEARREHILRSTRQEEEKFLVTIEGGMARFDAVAPHPGQSTVAAGDETTEPSPESSGVISGEEAFRLYDTFGFPLDLTQVMARERGFEVDEEGFEAALEEQRIRSRADRADSGVGRSGPSERRLDDWQAPSGTVTQTWVGWDSIEVETEVVAWTEAGETVGLILASNPFYLRAGGQVSDIGVVEGEDWSLTVGDVQAVEGRTAVSGPVSGSFPAGSREPLPVLARVDRRVRLDTERNHTATHVLHAVLREVLGEHVMQRGSLVDPDRLRFDFSHPEPLSRSELRMIEEKVNRAIWDDVPVRWRIVPRDEALASGAMALFGEKYGDEVRMVEIPGVSLELCGGTHLHHTGSIGPFRIVREGGVASGVRRLEAVTGPQADARFREAEEQLAELSRKLRTNQEALPRKVEELLHEKDELETLLAEARKGGGTPERLVHEEDVSFEGDGRARYRGLRLRVRDADDARSFGDAFREQETSSVAVVATEAADGRQSVFVFVTDDLVSKGVRAGDIVKEVAGMVGGRGGGRPHMAQGGVEDAARLDEALRHGASMVRTALAKAAT